MCGTIFVFRQYEASNGKRIPLPSLPASPEVMLATNGTTETTGEKTFTSILFRVVSGRPKTIPFTHDTVSAATAWTAWLFVVWLLPQDFGPVQKAAPEYLLLLLLLDQQHSNAHCFFIKFVFSGTKLFA